ncbi:MAG: hypothetical protein KKF48_02735 [Nanoarchaeota archaeon]|nr:hypothetical protein [Nanoarchaeota archaeon]
MKNILNSKAGKTSIWLIVGGIGIMLLLGMIAYNVSQSTVQRTELQDTPGGCADSTGVLTVNDRSESDYGTAPGSPAITCGVDGEAVTTSVTSGTTTFAVGSGLECIAVIDDYLDEAFSFKMPCGGKQLDAPLWYSTSDNPSITWYNDDDNAMTNNIVGGTVNQTDLSAGETFTLEVKIQGTSGESSGDGILIVEFAASTSSNITSATLGGKQSIGVPSVHTLQTAGGKAFAFEVDAVEEGNVVKLPFQVTLTAGKDLDAGVYTTWYTKQKFIDDDKTIKYGVQDSDGTAKYENTISSDFYIN